MTAMLRMRQSVAGGFGDADALPIPLAQPIRSRWPQHSEEEIAEVGAILRSGRVNALHHGERCRAFEAAFADRCAMPHAMAVANGTLALELALRALGVGPGDEVVVPARSFMASASCVVAVGAKPVFADVDPDTQCVNAHTLAVAFTPRTKAVIAVHLGGWPCPVDEIAVLVRAYGIHLIEDCAQAHGASIDGKPVGSFGDAAAFSFCTDKIISTGGEGGMLLLRDPAVWARAWAYKDHGKCVPVPGVQDASPASPGTFRWLHDSFGSNFRLTEMQAAIGLHQLERLDATLAVRRRNARALARVLAALPAVRQPLPGPDIGHACYKHYAFVRPERLRTGWSRDRIVAEIGRAGIPCGTGTCPEIYLERAFRGSASVPSSRLPISRILGETSMILPVDPTLDEAMIATMADVVAAVVTAATH